MVGLDQSIGTNYVHTCSQDTFICIPLSRDTSPFDLPTQSVTLLTYYITCFSCMYVHIDSTGVSDLEAPVATINMHM